MKVFSSSVSTKTLDRAVIITGILAVLVTVAFVGYYLFDRYYRPPAPTALDAARSRVEEMINKDPNNASVRITAGLIYREAKTYPQAIAQLEEALKLQENSEKAYVVLGMTYLDMGDKDRATENFGKVVEIGKDSEFAGMDSNLESAHYFLGKIYLDNGDLDQAIENLNLALSIDRTDSDAYYLVGVAHTKRGEYEDAVKAFNDALAFVPNYVEAYRGRAEAYDLQGQVVRAKTDKALAGLFANDYDRAVSEFKSIVAEAPEAADAFWGLGVAYQMRGKRDDAIDAYKKAVAADPKHRQALGALSQLGVKPD